MKKIFLILVLIFLFGFILRFYNLGIFPGSLHRDEAFLGYNAYSILSTGKDMSAKLLPLHLESFIYSPAGYSYFTIPFILLFDLSEFSVRSASAFFGALSILALYFLVKELFKRDNLALLSAFFLAISPWHINLSRTATENVIVVFFLLLGILFFVKYLRKGYKYLFISFLCFSITILLYQAPRAFLPIFIPFLIFVFIDRKKIIKDKFILGFLYLFLIVLPVIYILSSADLSLRIKSLSIFENSNTQLLLTEQITNDGKYGLPYVATRVFHNKIIANLLMFSENYSKHFTFDFLFLDKGFPDRYRVPQMGLLYVHELPLILSGLFIMLKKQRRVGLFLLGWLLISPIGSALASDDVPNLQRTLISVPVYSIVSAYGLILLLHSAKSLSRHLFRLSVLIPVCIIVFSLFYYLVQYYTQARNYRTWYRQDGYKELVNKVSNLSAKYRQVIVTNRESAPTIFFLFYNKYSPSLFQKAAFGSDHRSFDRMNFGKYIFTQEECPLKAKRDDGTEILISKEVLYVNSALCKEFPVGSRLLAEIRRADSSSVFYILDSINND